MQLWQDAFADQRSDSCVRRRSHGSVEAGEGGGEVVAGGFRLRYERVWEVFHRLTGQAGLGARSPGCTPRIHDLRHSFAVSTLVGWYRDGADVNAMLPLLSTYLGHTDPKHTYWYLSAAPELLALATDRLVAHHEAL